jgi:hypothetical protein
MKNLTFLVGLSVLLVVGCQKEEGLTIKNQTVEFRDDYAITGVRSFKGQISGTIPKLNGSLGSGKVKSGELFGNMTHLGNTIVEYTISRQPRSTRTQSSTADQFFYRMEGEYIAPPLDTLIIITDFFTFPDPENDETNTVEGEFEIKGGKGRFKNATGSGEIKGRSTADPADPKKAGVTLEFDGTIIF